MRHSILSTILKAAAYMAAAFIAFPCAAMPASTLPVWMSDGNGGYVRVLVHGDEHCHAVTTSDGSIQLRLDDSGRLSAAGAFDAVEFNARRLSARRRAIGNTNTFPCYGTQRAIAVLVEFPATDKHPQGRRFRSENPRELFDRLLNADDYSDDGAGGSVRSYFKDNSNGAFDLTFDVFGPVMLSEDVQHYIDETGSWQMVEEACRGIDADVDFSTYDRDSDGVIDNVYIFYAGPGGATGGNPDDCIWQHASDVEVLSGKQFVFDGVRLNHYACSNEYRAIKDTYSDEVRLQTEGIGTVCHEFSHVLGLPDLYDVNYNGNPSPYVWDVMDTGCHLNDSRTPAAYSALDRMLLGWLEPEDIGDSPRTLSLTSIDSNKAYRIATTDPNEFFLLENRQQTGWDAALPAHGLLLWRVNYQPDYWKSNLVNTGRGSSHAIIVCADGHYGEGTYEGDPFPGSTRSTGITDDGYPNMLSSRGERTNAPLSNIVEAGGIISFDVCRAVTSLEKVRGLRVADLTPTAFTAVWDAIPMSPGYVLNVTTPSGEPAGIYQDLNVASTSVRVTGLEPDTEYVFTVYGAAGVVRGEVSDPCTVTTPAMSFAFTAPHALEADETGPHSFRAVWQPLDGAVDYAVRVLTLHRGADRMAVADFTGGIEALPAGWSTNCLSTLSISGYYGKAAPALSMGADYARIQSPLLDHELLSLEFWYRERSASGRSSIAVEVLNGREWMEIDRIELPASMAAGQTYTADAIPEGSLAVRLIYHRVDKGTLAVDDVKITFRGDDETYPLEGWAERRMGSDDTFATVDGLEPATDYYYSVRGVNDQGVLSASSGLMRVTTAETSSLSGVEAGSCGELRIYDLQGRRVYPQSMAPGIYILKTDTNTKKLIYR